MYYTAPMSSSAAPDHPSPSPRWNWLNPHSTRAGAWTSDSLLEHARLENRRLEALDVIQRNFFYPWPAVAAHVPSYRTHALTQLAHMGAERPISRSPYLNETLTAV